MAELGAGGGSGYPAVIDTDAALEVDNVDNARADVPNDLADAIIKIEAEMGTDPAGASADLKTRLGNVLAAEFAQLETLGATTISAAQWGALGALVEWTDWVPNLVGGGATLPNYDVARYYRIGDLCFFQFECDTELVGGAAGHIRITLPFTAANTGVNMPVTNIIDDGTANWIYTGTDIAGNTNFLGVYKTANFGNWASGETISIRACGFFEIA